MKTKAIFICILTGLISLSFQNTTAQECDPVRELQEDFLELKFGMFIHYNMATYQGVQWVEGYPDPSEFNPGVDLIDTDAWADAALAAGMKYGVLTVKHVGGFCLWDSKYTSYDIMHPDCPYKKDLVAQFVKSFKDRGLKVGLYYCWRHPGFDVPNKNRSAGPYKVLPPECDPATHSLEEQITFQKAQIAELIKKYPDVSYIWNDALDPEIMAADEILTHIRGIRPDVLVSANWWDWSKKGTPYADIAVTEMRHFPEDNKAAGETCWCLEQSWFWDRESSAKSADEILPLITKVNSRNANFLLNVGPDQNGNIIESSLQTLTEIGELNGSSGERPNIVFILTDDQGYGDLGAHGNPFLKTPNMDQLYQESARFTDFVVSPTCAPTRCALMTGKHEFRSGVTHTVSGRREMSLQSTTVAQLLKSAGYTTGIFGKWHLGSNGEYRPEKRGFDVSITSVDDTQRSHFDPVLLFNGVEKQTRGFRENILFDEAMQFIESNKNGPFFCYIPTYSPHAPLKAPQEYIDRNNGNVFYAMISNIDDNIGRLMEKLKKLKLDDNTVVILVNDNGGTWGVDNYNAGMRGCKGTPWYGGTRALSFWRWPGHIKPGNIENLAAHVDLLPTLAELAGAGLPEKLEDGLDGVSLLPLFKDNKKILPDRMVISHMGRWPDGKGEVEAHKYAICSVHWNNYLLVRSQTCGRDDCRGECHNFQNVIDGSTATGYSKKADFHYAVNLQRRWALYDVNDDPAQRVDLASEFPEIVENMSGAYENWWTEVLPYIHRVAEDPRWSQDYIPQQK